MYCNHRRAETSSIGSITASIRGVNIIPRDIDVIVDVCDFWRAKDVYGEFIIEPFSECLEDDVVRFFGKININNIVIDISAKPKNIYGRHTIEMLCWNGHIIKSQTLELLYRVYQKNARDDYIKAIDEYLSQVTL